MVGSINGRSSIKIANFVQIHSKDASYQAVSIEIWWEAPMEGSVLSFLKAE
jgi:hypothetical protein